MGRDVSVQISYVPTSIVDVHRQMYAIHYHWIRLPVAGSRMYPEHSPSFPGGGGRWRPPSRFSVCQHIHCTEGLYYSLVVAIALGAETRKNSDIRSGVDTSTQ